MKRSQSTLIVCVIALVASAAVHAAQSNSPFPPRRSSALAGPPGNGCTIEDSTDDAYQRASPAQRQVMDRARADLDQRARQFARDRELRSSAAAPMEITIPVVVHVVHDNGPENISDAQIIAAIDQMTEDFHAYPFAGSVDGYGYLQANVGFTFKLARLDPQGQPTSGITRTRSTVTYNGTEGPLQATINWPREKYLNIWVVYSSDGANGSAYSNYPATVADGSGVEYWDGIVVSYWAVGPYAVSGYEKILTHEAGHWADLIHTWGDTYYNGDARACSDPLGDQVADTPLTTGNSGCSASSTCGYADNTENFMDYGTCTTMFSDGQSDRMQTAMLSSVARRSNIWSQANLVATGLAPGNPPPTEVLQNGVAKTGLSAAAGANLNFTMDVPAGATNLRFAMSGGSGDADMHVRFGSPPTLSTYDCRPFAGDNNETCNINPAQAGRYHVMLNASTAFSGVRLTGSYTDGGTPPTLPECTASDTRQLDKNCARSNRSETAGNYDYMYVWLPAGVQQLKLTVSGGTGDADLYVSSTGWAGMSNYQYSSTNVGNNETLTIANPPAGYLYISLYADLSFSGVKIATEY